MRINANSDGSNWTGQIQSVQGIGSFTYQTVDRGRLQARLKRLSLPVADAPAYLPDAEQAILPYPALDVETDTCNTKKETSAGLSCGRPTGDTANRPPGYRCQRWPPGNGRELELPGASRCPGCRFA